MVLERLVSIRTAMKKPVWMFVIGGIVSVACLIISYLVFQTSVGMFTAFLVTFAVTPFMVNLTSMEEAREEQIPDIEKMNIFQRHRQILSVYIAFFAGMILTLSIVYLSFPSPVVQKIFEDQINEITLIRGNVTFGGTYETILLNNLGVLFLTFLFSFLFGAGAVFILAWNASVLAAAIGMAAKSIGGIAAFPLATLMFFPHGSLEILAYFIGGIAGGLVSAVISKRKSGKMFLIIKDSLQLMAVSVVLLIVAAFIESFQIVV